MIRTIIGRQHSALLGLAGLTVAGIVAFRSGVASAPDVGELPMVRAQPAERVQLTRLHGGDTFGELLAEAGVPAEEHQALLLAFQERASPRRLRAGTEVTFRYARDEGTLRRVDVELNPDETVRLTRSPVTGWTSATVETPSWTDTIFVAGEIRGSLWESVVGNPDLAEVPSGDRNRLLHYLDLVFQWQIDFSRQIQNGDFYRFAFEREVRPDGSMRSGKVLVAELVNVDRPFEAVWFDPDGDGEGTYYDRDGKSVRRAFLKKPLEFRRISSRFTLSRFHPILKTWRAHRGVDYAASAGTEVQSTADGVVVHRGPNGGYGNLVEVQHANGFRTRYAHLRGFASGVGVGSRVRQGQVIGYVGATGLATAPHLHYEMLKSGRQVDPLAIDLPAGDPVPDEAWDVWETQSGVRFALLERLPDRERFREIVAGREARAERRQAADAKGDPDGTEEGSPPGER